MEEGFREEKNTKRDYFEIGAIFLVIFGLYMLLNKLDVIPKFGISENMTYGFIFLIGLTAAFSTCLAVTGGLLLGITARYNEINKNLSGFSRFKPHIYFNIGRIISYAFFGGIIGAIGSFIAFSPRLNGFITIFASIFMILLGLKLLKIFPKLRIFQIRMPKFLTHKIHDLSSRQGKTAPFLLGASTFFLPCGFTQALQLYVLSKGDFLTGMMTMGVFSLGTLPTLMSIGAVSSFLKGTFQRYFIKFAGILVIVLGIFNISNGLVLAGFNFDLTSSLFSKYDQNLLQDKNSEILKNEKTQESEDRQIVSMKIVGLNYYPHQFTVRQGIPVEWRIDGSEAQGCAQVITVPKLGIVKYISPKGITKITFTPQEVGKIEFSCTMGMTTKGAAFIVIPNDKKSFQVKEEVKNGNKAECNPEIMDCNVQKIYMEISREKGFYPNTFVIKKGIPVELEIDAKVQLGGCMSTLVIPEYNIAHLITFGKSTLKFTPTKTGTIPFTCSMGSKMGEFIITA